MAMAKTSESDVTDIQHGCNTSNQFEQVSNLQPIPGMLFDMTNHAPQTSHRLSAVTCVHPADSGGSGQSDRALTPSEPPGRVQPAFTWRLPEVVTNAANDNEPEAFPSAPAGTHHNDGGDVSHTGEPFGTRELVARGAASHSEFVNHPVANGDYDGDLMHQLVMEEAIAGGGNLRRSSLANNACLGTDSGGQLVMWQPFRRCIHSFMRLLEEVTLS
jgi:hypothetical protein